MGLLDGVKKIVRKDGQPESNDIGQAAGEPKQIHLVEMANNNEAGARQDIYIKLGTTLGLLREKLNIDPRKPIIRGKNRQVLRPEDNIYDILEYGEKLTILPPTDIGLP